jgi:hypothetical protein
MKLQASIEFVVDGSFLETLKGSALTTAHSKIQVLRIQINRITI